jgi:hypothetical protein
MKQWNKRLSTRRQRLLNEIRKFQYDEISKPECSPFKIDKGMQVIRKINERLYDKTKESKDRPDRTPEG